LPIFVVLADNYRAGSLTPEISDPVYPAIKPIWCKKLRRLVVKIFKDQLNFRFPGAADTVNLHPPMNFRDPL